MARISTGADSKQDYRTPTEFMQAVERRFGPVKFDLAAHRGNAQAARWYGPGGEAEDSLTQPWHKLDGLLWLNPPFSPAIAPWAEKAAMEAQCGARIAFLVPASVGAVWFREHVAPFADVQFLGQRLCFDGKAPYPKDCLLALFGDEPGACVWNWHEGPRAVPVAWRLL